MSSLYSALKLAAKEWPRKVVPDIILIDTKDRFLFKPLMYELLTEEAPIDVIAPKFAELIDEEKVGGLNRGQRAVSCDVLHRLIHEFSLDRSHSSTLKSIASLSPPMIAAVLSLWTTKASSHSITSSLRRAPSLGWSSFQAAKPAQRRFIT